MNRYQLPRPRRKAFLEAFVKTCMDKGFTPEQISHMHGLAVIDDALKHNPEFRRGAEVGVFLQTKQAAERIKAKLN